MDGPLFVAIHPITRRVADHRSSGNRRDWDSRPRAGDASTFSPRKIRSCSRSNKAGSRLDRIGNGRVKSAGRPALSSAGSRGASLAPVDSNRIIVYNIPAWRRGCQCIRGAPPRLDGMGPGTAAPARRRISKHEGSENALESGSFPFGTSAATRCAASRWTESTSQLYRTDGRVLRDVEHLARIPTHALCERHLDGKRSSERAPPPARIRHQDRRGCRRSDADPVEDVLELRVKGGWVEVDISDP